MSDIDFVRLKTTFDGLPPGPKADIRRAASPGDLGWLPAFYKLLPPGAQPTPQWERIVFLLPWAGHKPGAKPLGRAMKSGRIAEMRLFQMAKSDPPQDIIHLRRILRQIKPSLDWKEFGSALYYWGDTAKKHILQDYFYNPDRED